MYGMIHKAGRYAVLKLFGEQTWANTLERCGLKDEHFISAAHYDDATTYALLHAIAAECEITYEQVLQAAGRYWVEYATEAGYGGMFTLTGRTLAEFLENLDRMHTSLTVTLPKAVMPSFNLVSANANHLEVIYQSERDGLEEFVLGILEGLVEHFEEPMAIKYTIKEDGAHFNLKRISKIALTEDQISAVMEMAS